MSTIPRGIHHHPRSILAGAALLLAAGAGPAQAGPAAEEVFVGSVLVSSPAFPAAVPAGRWDGRGNASESFVREVLLPRAATTTAAASDDRSPQQSEAAELFVNAVLKP